MTSINSKQPRDRLKFPLIGLKGQGWGMVRAVERFFREIIGVEFAYADPSTGMIVIEFVPEKIDAVTVASAMHAGGHPPERVQIRIGIEGINCISCSRFIEDELIATPGVVDASVDLITQEAVVEYLPEKAQLTQLNDAIHRWGYRTCIEMNVSAQ